MAEEKKWQDDAQVLKELLNLETSPVGISCLKEQAQDEPQEKVRICRAFPDAAKGKTLKINRSNNACFGAAWHLEYPPEFREFLQKRLTK